jgi:uncharacterized membrane protein YjjB (DUF3815 family)
VDLLASAVNSLYTGLFASGLGILFMALPRYLVPAFLCGFAGRFARDAFMSWGMGLNWSIGAAAVVVVLIAVASLRRHVVSPVVLVSGILPLGASVAMFNMTIELMKVSSLKGQALSEASVALSANVGRVFTTSMAIALGLAVGMAIVRLLKRQKVWEGV